MKKLLFLCSAILIAAISLNAQVLYSDDFESYNVDEGIALQCPEWWDTWSGDPGSDEDPLVSDNYALSGTKSVQVFGNNDGVIDFGGITEGRYRVEFYILIAEGRQGYYNIMQNFNPSGTGLVWGLQVFFQNGVCTIDGGGQSAASFNYEAGEWMKFQHFIDLNSDWIDMYVNDQLILAYQWSNGTFGTGGVNQLGAFDFYAWNEGGTCEYYMDDFLIEEVETPYPPTNFNAEIINDNDVLLTWNAPEEGEPVSYSIVRNGNEIALVGDSVLTYTDENLFPQTYTYQLYAFYGTSSGYSSSAGIEVVTIPGGNQRELVLFETFTGTWCPYCPTAAQASQMMETEGLSVAKIQYQVNDYYETPASPVRHNFYFDLFGDPEADGFGVPTTIINGTTALEGTAPTVQEHFEIYEYYYEEYINIPTLYTIDAFAQITADPSVWEVDITVEETFPYFDDEMRLMVVLTETNIPESWHGETSLNNVARSMYPDANGTVLDFSTNNPIQESFNITIDPDYDVDNCYVIMFVQNMVNGDVNVAYKLKLTDVTSVKSIVDNNINIYPNPSNGIINVKSGENIHRVEVINTSGQIIYSQLVDNYNAGFDLSEHAKGVYFLKVYTNKDVSVHKLIKN